MGRSNHFFHPLHASTQKCSASSYCGHVVTVHQDVISAHKTTMCFAIFWGGLWICHASKDLLVMQSMTTIPPLDWGPDAATAGMLSMENSWNLTLRHSAYGGRFVTGTALVPAGVILPNRLSQSFYKKKLKKQNSLDCPVDCTGPEHICNQTKKRIFVFFPQHTEFSFKKVEEALQLVK